MDIDVASASTNQIYNIQISLVAPRDWFWKIRLGWKIAKKGHRTYPQRNSTPIGSTRPKVAL